MFIQKSHLTLAAAASLFAFTNGAMMASAYAAEETGEPSGFVTASVIA